MARAAVEDGAAQGAEVSADAGKEPAFLKRNESAIMVVLAILAAAGTLLGVVLPEIRDVRTDLGGRIDSLSSDMGDQITELRDDMRQDNLVLGHKIDTERRLLLERIDALSDNVLKALTDLGIDDMAEVDRLHESGELEEFFATRRRAYQDRYRAEGVARGIERGIEQGLAAERELLRRQAARKFGAGTAGRLAGLLAGVGDADQLAQAGDWIIDCATGEELIACFGNGSPRGS